MALDLAAPTAAPTPAPTPTPGPIVPTLIDRVPGAEGVGLTFHLDGDVALATELFDVLSERRTPITAMVIGQWLEANPAGADRLTAGGHEVANHSYSHGDMPSMAAAEIRAEIDRCAEVLLARFGTIGRWFRPSAVDVPSPLMVEVAAEAGYEATVGFNVDPVDYRAAGAEPIVAGVLDVVGPGDIVSLHFGYPATNAALPPLIDGLRERGLEPATVSELMAQAAT